MCMCWFTIPLPFRFNKLWEKGILTKGKPSWLRFIFFLVYIVNLILMFILLGLPIVFGIFLDKVFNIQVPFNFYQWPLTIFTCLFAIFFEHERIERKHG